MYHQEFSGLYTRFKEAIGKERSHNLEFASQDMLRKSQDSIEIMQRRGTGQS